ncbi:MAG: penicillin-binding protein 2 [Bryobacteraceae bacterium]|nr:penicillin-binding protein 2 [Bryobacteraceae bacterium]
MYHVPTEAETEKERVEQRRFRRDDVSQASGKIAFFQYISVGLFLFLISGFWRLQIESPEVYSEQADRNRIKSIPILAARGKILDRDGRVIVDNHSSFSLILSRDNLKQEHLRPIAEGLNMDYEDLVARVHRFRKRPTYEAIVIKEELTPAEMAFVESHQDPGTFPELELIHAQRRLYPKDGLGAHMIGYVGEVSEAELNTAEFIDYEPGDVVGKQGLEREYNKQLMGVDGQRQVVVDKLGMPRKVIGDKPAVPGKNLQLSIDLDLQAVAELALQDRRGAVVALDPRSGEVLAMVSRPAYDPNRFAGRIRSKDWKEILDNPDKPLLNRATQSRLAPGSTFKPIMALAGLESGALTEDFKVHCAGGASFYGRPFKCHKRGGHGTVALNRAIAGSCDVFFYTLGNKMGIDTIAKYAEMSGFGSKSGVDLPHESEGLVPSTRWKMRTFRQKWYAGETISVAIGQGALEVSPIQLARSIGGIVTGGVWQVPHIAMEAAGRSEAHRENIGADTVMQIINGMYSVVNEGGTAPMARLPGISLSGKTGTAQLASNDVLKGTALGRTMKDNGWFVGFAPRENPEIVVVALIEAGLHGTTAAIPVRDVVKAYFDKKARAVPRERLAKLPSLDPRAAAVELLDQITPHSPTKPAFRQSALIARLGERRMEAVSWP